MKKLFTILLTALLAVTACLGLTACGDKKVEEGATVTRAIVASGVKIGKGAVVGSADSENIILVSKNVKGVE